MPGPVPKRSDQRRRRNKPAGGEVTQAPSKVPSAEAALAAPEPDELWHPVAQDWFRSLALSGQSEFYEPSDWAQARYIAHEMSRSLEGRFSGQAMVAITSAMTELLTTEGARRRARLELQKTAPPDPKATSKVTRMDAYRKAAEGG